MLCYMSICRLCLLIYLALVLFVLSMHAYLKHVDPLWHPFP
jgi:hypothetical protein